MSQILHCISDSFFHVKQWSTALPSPKFTQWYLISKFRLEKSSFTSSLDGLYKTKGQILIWYAKHIDLRFDQNSDSFCAFVFQFSQPSCNQDCKFVDKFHSIIEFQCTEIPEMISRNPTCHNTDDKYMQVLCLQSIFLRPKFIVISVNNNCRANEVPLYC